MKRRQFLTAQQIRNVNQHHQKLSGGHGAEKFHHQPVIVFQLSCQHLLGQADVILLEKLLRLRLQFPLPHVKFAKTRTNDEKIVRKGQTVDQAAGTVNDSDLVLGDGMRAGTVDQLILKEHMTVSDRLVQSDQLEQLCSAMSLQPQHTIDLSLKYLHTQVVQMGLPVFRVKDVIHPKNLFSHSCLRFLQAGRGSEISTSVPVPKVE